MSRRDVSIEQLWQALRRNQHYRRMTESLDDEVRVAVRVLSATTGCHPMVQDFIREAVPILRRLMITEAPPPTVPVELFHKAEIEVFLAPTSLPKTLQAPLRGVLTTWREINRRLGIMYAPVVSPELEKVRCPYWPGPIRASTIVYTDTPAYLLSVALDLRHSTEVLLQEARTAIRLRRKFLRQSSQRTPLYPANVSEHQWKTRWELHDLHSPPHGRGKSFEQIATLWGLKGPTRAPWLATEPLRREFRETRRLVEAVFPGRGQPLLLPG